MDKSAHHLLIDDADNNDNSVVTLSEQELDELQLYRGDTVLLKGKRRHETVCIVNVDDSCPNDRIRMNRVVRNNLRVHSGDIISIQDTHDIKYGQRIHVLPIDDTVQGITDNLYDDYLKPYFNESYRPVHKGDVFIVNAATNAVQFKVISTDPSPYCIVAPDTIIYCEGDQIKREDEQKALWNEIDFDDVGGLENAKCQLKELITSPQKFLKSGTKPSRGALIYGPSGCGKTLLSKAIAYEFQLNVIEIQYVELWTMLSGGPETKIHDAFEKACQMKPCVLFINDLDSIGMMATGNLDGETSVADRIINQLAIEMDGIDAKRNIFVISTTYRPDKIPSILFQPGRFRHLIYVPLPDEKSRVAILKRALCKSPVSKDVDINYLAHVTNGFSGADLIEICQRACKMAIRESIEKEQQSHEHIAVDSGDHNLVLEVRRDHFEEVLKSARRSISDNDALKIEMFALTGL